MQVLPSSPQYQLNKWLHHQKSLSQETLRRQWKRNRCNYWSELATLLSSCCNQNLLEGKAKTGSVLTCPNHNIIDLWQRRQNNERSLLQSWHKATCQPVSTKTSVFAGDKFFSCKGRKPWYAAIMYSLSSMDSIFAVTSCPAAGNDQNLALDLTQQARRGINMHWMESLW